MNKYTNQQLTSAEVIAELIEMAREVAAEADRGKRRDVKTDWTVRDDVRAKLRSSIKRLLVKHKYPPDKQPEAIKLVIDQMEAMAPRYAA
jgi:type I restriction enzyme R subunit